MHHCSLSCSEALVQMEDAVMVLDVFDAVYT